MREHVCDATVPICSCGNRWDYKRTWSDGCVTYTTALVRERCEALYGKPAVPFERVGEKVRS